jgi:hypothetical protein
MLLVKPKVKFVVLMLVQNINLPLLGVLLDKEAMFSFIQPTDDALCYYRFAMSLFSAFGLDLPSSSNDINECLISVIP